MNQHVSPSDPRIATEADAAPGLFDEITDTEHDAECGLLCATEAAPICPDPPGAFALDLKRRNADPAASKGIVP